MALDVECVVDGGVNGQETLGGSGRFETLHLALAPSCRLMRILSPIVCTQAVVMASRQSNFGLRRAVRAQLVGHQHIGREALFLEQLAHQFHRCGSIAPSLHEQVENLAFVVNRAPKPELPPRDRHGHLIEMPPRGWPRASTPKFSGEQRPELQYPSPHRFVGDIQTALRQQIFDVAIAECEADVQPNGVPDDRGGNWWRARSSCAILAAEL
jgi:hypothetical protein